MAVNPDALSFEEAVNHLITLTELKDDDIIVMKITPLEFIGKVWRDTDYPTVWKEAHASGFMQTLYALQGHKRDFTLFIKDALMIGIEKPSVKCCPEDFDHITIPESLWAVAFAKDGSANEDIVSLWDMLDKYIPDAEYQFNDEIPIIEKYPGGPNQVDIHLLMKPLKAK